MQIVEWYDELVRLTDSPVVRLNRAVAVGEADGPRPVSPRSPRWTRVAAVRRGRGPPARGGGDLATAARLYAAAARRRPASPSATTSTRQAARLNATLR